MSKTLDKTVRLWDTVSGALLETLEEGTTGVTDPLALSFKFQLISDLVFTTPRRHLKCT
jgi:hypothetical protein